MNAYPSLRLSDQTAEAIQAAERLVHRDFALQNLHELLDPDHTQSTWALAGDIAKRLRQFQPVAYRRIVAGHREPCGMLENALSCLCAAGCPTSQRRLFDLLYELRF